MKNSLKRFKKYEVNNSSSVTGGDCAEGETRYDLGSYFWGAITTYGCCGNGECDIHTDFF